MEFIMLNLINSQKMKASEKDLKNLAAQIEKDLFTERRKKLSASSMTSVLNNLKDPSCSISWCSANWINNGKGLTHLFLAVKVKEVVVIGIQEGSVQRSSPGRAWNNLKPWNPDNSTFKKKVLKWAEEQKIFIKFEDIDPFSTCINKINNGNLSLNEINKNRVIKEKVRL